MVDDFPQDITQEEAISRQVFEALGKASMCWSEVPSGVFDSTRAKEIGDDLIKFINSLIPFVPMVSIGTSDAQMTGKEQRIMELHTEVPSSWKDVKGVLHPTSCRICWTAFPCLTIRIINEGEK